MAAEDTLKKIEERLTRLEASIAQVASGGAGGFVPPGGAVVDPAPWVGGGGGWGYPHWPHPVVDPAAFYYHRPVVDPAVFHRPVVDPAAFHRPGPVVDPAAFHRPVVDPAAWAARPAVAAVLGGVGVVGGDPPPPDISRFSIAQLEAALHSIAAEQARLGAMETQIKQQLEKARKQG